MSGRRLVVTMLLGLVIGAIAVRRQGIYFAMITLALGQLVFFVCLQADLRAARTAFKAFRGAISLA